MTKTELGLGEIEKVEDPGKDLYFIVVDESGVFHAKVDETLEVVDPRGDNDFVQKHQAEIKNQIKALTTPKQ
jgi:hypothetical protein